MGNQHQLEVNIRQLVQRLFRKEVDLSKSKEKASNQMKIQSDLYGNIQLRKRIRSNDSYRTLWDVGRLNDQTVAEIWRVNIKDNHFYSTMVNIFVLGRQAETKTFERQAIDLKELIELYMPREVVIDTNGLGQTIAQVKSL